MADVTLNSKAYCKLILHAAKYPHCAINGVILAEKSKGKEVKFVDAVPLFHLSLTLAPMMEVALAQIDSYCKAHNLVIGGYYQANEHMDYQDIKPGNVAERIADRIHDHFNDACLFMIDNQRMSPECERNVLRVYQRVDTEWRQRDQKNSVSTGTLAAASSALKSRAYRELVDFDNHLDNIELDWKNTAINELLRHYS